MNERFEIDSGAVAIARLTARAESVERGELWMTAVVHASFLLVLFLAIAIGFSIASDVWPELARPNDAVLDIARILLLVGAAWVLASNLRRSAQTRQLEIEILRDEIREIQQRSSNS